MRTPEDESAGGIGADMDDWDSALLAPLTPLPKTPAPDAVARYVANITPETPATDQTSYDLQQLMTRTCPPKASDNPYFAELGAGILKREKDEKVLMRLMAARRKSLQFAPKVASPLSKTWH
jgi:hypothetical protein